MMKNNNLIGFSGKMGSGKDTVATIWQAVDYYFNNMCDDTSVNIGVIDYVKHIIETNKTDFGNWERRYFAYKLKKIVSVLTGCTVEDLNNQEFKSQKLSEEWATTKLFCDNGFYKLIDCDEYIKYRKTNGGVILDTLGYSYVIEKYIPTYRELLQTIGTDLFRKYINPNTWIISTFADYYENKKWLITDVRFYNEVKAIEDRNGIVIRVNRNSENNSIQHSSECELDEYKNWDFVINNNGSIESLIRKVIDIMFKLGYFMLEPKPNSKFDIEILKQHSFLVNSARGSRKTTFFLFNLIGFAKLFSKQNQNYSYHLAVYKYDKWECIFTNLIEICEEEKVNYHIVNPNNFYIYDTHFYVNRKDKNYDRGLYKEQILDVDWLNM